MSSGRVVLILLILLISSTALAQDETAAAEVEHPLDVGASFMSRWETRHYYGPAGLDAADFFRTRARLSLATQPLDVSDGTTAHVRFVPQATGLWHVGGNGLGDPAMSLHEGVLVITSPTLRTEVGRFEMAYGEHLVIGNVGWHETGRAFDGLRLRLSPYDEANFWIDVFATVLTEGFAEGPNVNPFGSGDEYFFGLYGTLGPAFGDSIAIDAYVLARFLPTSDELQRDSATEPTIGVRVKHRVGAIDFRLETGVQIGTRPSTTPDTDNPSVFAFHGDLEIGLNLADDKFRVSLEGAYASGDDPDTDDLENWDQLFPTAHKWMGFMDVVGGRSNIIDSVLHLSYWALDDVRLSLDSHGFILVETADGIDSLRGTELDFGVLYRLGQGLGLRGGAGIFMPGEDFGDDTLYFTELELKFQM